MRLSVRVLKRLLKLPSEETFGYEALQAARRIPLSPPDRIGCTTRAALSKLGHMNRRHRPPGRPEDQPLEQCWRLGPGPFYLASRRPRAAKASTYTPTDWGGSLPFSNWDYGTPKYGDAMSLDQPTNARCPKCEAQMIYITALPHPQARQMRRTTFVCRICNRTWNYVLSAEMAELYAGNQTDQIGTTN